MKHIDNEFNFLHELKNNYEDKFNNSSILEIGSAFDRIPVRVFFDDCDYMGIDLSSGLGVDRIINGAIYDAEDEFYDVVLAHYSLEFNKDYDKIFFNMLRMCKKGGLIIIMNAAENESRKSFSKYRQYLNQSSFQFYNMNNLFSKYEFIEGSRYLNYEIPIGDFMNFYSNSFDKMREIFEDKYSHYPNYEELMMAFEEQTIQKLKKDSEIANLNIEMVGQNFFYGEKK